MHIKWYFWLERWKNVMRHFIDEVALNLIPSSEAVNKTLATILAILIHDCIYKEGSTIILNRYNTICKLSTDRAHNRVKVFEIILFFEIQARWITDDPDSNSDSTYRRIVYNTCHDRYLQTSSSEKK